MHEEYMKEISHIAEGAKRLMEATSEGYGQSEHAPMVALQLAHTIWQSVYGRSVAPHLSPYMPPAMYEQMAAQHAALQPEPPRMTMGQTFAWVRGTVALMTDEQKSDFFAVVREACSTQRAGLAEEGSS